MADAAAKRQIPPQKSPDVFDEEWERKWRNKWSNLLGIYSV